MHFLFFNPQNYKLFGKALPLLREKESGLLIKSITFAPKLRAMSKTIFLTGATGTMGWAGLQELLKRTDRFRVVVLARKSKKNIRKLQPLMDKIKVVWGDLTHYEDVLAGVTGADYVLHVG